jgi:hypothetical protein
MAKHCEICSKKIPRGTMCRKCWLRKTQAEIIATKTITEGQIKLLKRESKRLLAYLYSNVYEAFEPANTLSQREINILNEIQKTFGLSNKDVRYEERIGQQVSVDTAGTTDELSIGDLSFEELEQLESRPAFRIEDCCRQFYDENIFGETTVGTDVWADLLNNYFESIAEADQAFSAADKELFRNEMTALRMILFAFALGDSKNSNEDEFAIPASFFTRSYLEKKGRLDIFEIISAYNRAIARSAIMDANLQKYSGKTGNALIIRVNDLRSRMALKWADIYVGDRAIPLQEQKNKIACINMVANRLGADIEREDGVVVKSLCAELATRLRDGENLNSEAMSKLSAIILNFYRGAAEYLGSVVILPGS